MREIPPDVAAAERVPDDLDSSGFEAYAVPSPRRRRTAGVVVLCGAAVAALAAMAGLPAGYWAVAAGLGVIGVLFVATAWDLDVREGKALEVANTAVSFPVGHASAQVAFTGWRVRPVWHVLVFSADDPPSRRGLVRVSALDGAVLDVYEDEVPAVDHRSATGT